MKKVQNEVTVGMFVILGFVFLTLIVFFISGVYLFRPGYTLHVLYDYVSILDKGAPVRMAGVRIGEVSGVNLLFNGTHEKAMVKVKLFIEKGVEIRENYFISIRGTHVLSEPHIEITPLGGEAPLLQDGAIVEGAAPIPMELLIDRVDAISGGIETSVRSFNSILDGLEEGRGTAGKLLAEDALYQEMRGLVAEIKARPWRLLKKDDGRKKFLGIF